MVVSCFIENLESIGCLQASRPFHDLLGQCVETAKMQTLDSRCRDLLRTL